MVIKFLRRLKEGHKQIHDFKNFKIIEKPVRARKHRKFTKDNLTRAILLRYHGRCVENMIT